MVVYYNFLAGGRFELAMQLTAIGLVSLNSNSETHMTAICDARLIYGRGRISPVFISCGPLIEKMLWCKYLITLWLPIDKIISLICYGL